MKEKYAGHFTFIAWNVAIDHPLSSVAMVNTVVARPAKQLVADVQVGDISADR